MELRGPLHDTSKTYYSPPHRVMRLVGGKVPVWYDVDGYYYHPLTWRGVIVVAGSMVLFVGALLGLCAWIVFGHH